MTEQEIIGLAIDCGEKNQHPVRQNILPVDGSQKPSVIANIEPLSIARQLVSLSLLKEPVETDDEKKTTNQAIPFKPTNPFLQSPKRKWPQRKHKRFRVISGNKPLATADMTGNRLITCSLFDLAE